MVRANVLFRVDASVDVGLGHLQRCLSLATALRYLDGACYFLTNGRSIAGERVRAFGFEADTMDAIESWSVDDCERTVLTAATHRCNTIVVDSDYEGVEYLGQLREAGFFVCAIEDNAPHVYPCQLVVNGDAHAYELRYESCSGDTVFLLGPEYCMLGPEFWKVGSRATSDCVRNVLVTLGGADRYNLVPKVLALLGELPGTFRVTVIIGPYFENVSEVEAAGRHVGCGVTLVHSPHSVHDLMWVADVALSAGGQTLYELACAGCPTVAVEVASNQARQLQVFEEAGIIRVVGHAEDVGIVARIGDAVGSLLLDPMARAGMSIAGQRMIDGRGALRVAETILGKV